MSASDDNLSIFFCSIPPIHLITPILLALNAASLDRTCSRDAVGQQDKIPFRRSSQQMRTGRHTELELLPVHLREEG